MVKTNAYLLGSRAVAGSGDGGGGGLSPRWCYTVNKTTAQLQMRDLEFFWGANLTGHLS